MSRSCDHDLVNEIPPLARESVLALRLDRPFMFSRASALSLRAVMVEDRPVAIDLGDDRHG